MKFCLSSSAWNCARQLNHRKQPHRFLSSCDSRKECYSLQDLDQCCKDRFPGCPLDLLLPRPQFTFVVIPTGIKTLLSTHYRKSIVSYAVTPLTESELSVNGWRKGIPLDPELISRFRLLFTGAGSGRNSLDMGFSHRPPT